MIIPAPSAPASEPPIASSAWWPQIDPVEIREQQRIDNTVPAPRLRWAIIEAIATTNQALLAWRFATWPDAASLAEIEAEQIDGTSILVHRYQRAVGCLTKALLLERLRDFDATGKGDRKTEALTDPIDDCRRDHLNAIADIVGVPRVTVDLI